MHFSMYINLHDITDECQTLRNEYNNWGRVSSSSKNVDRRDWPNRKCFN